MGRWGDMWNSQLALEYHLLLNVVEVYAVPTRVPREQEEGETCGKQWHRDPTATEENWL